MRRRSQDRGATDLALSQRQRMSSACKTPDAAKQTNTPAPIPASAAGLSESTLRSAAINNSPESRDSA